MTGLPPLLAGADQLTWADCEPGTAATLSGAVATEPEVGVTALEGSDAGPEPLGFEAVTLKVYDVPPVRLWILAFVTGGEPVTVVGVCAVEPM